MTMRSLHLVVPAKAGIQRLAFASAKALGSRLRGNDETFCRSCSHAFHR
jgi:hypothetical protein